MDDFKLSASDLLVGLIIVLATVVVSHAKPWGFAQPPREACARSADDQATHTARSLPACPRQIREVMA